MATPPFHLPPQRLLVPLATLEHSLYRQLYPHDFDLDLFTMTQPAPESPKENPPSPTIPSKPEDPPESQEPQSPSSSQPSSPPTTNSTSTVVAEQTPAPGYHCQWVDCDKALPDPESLYNHLCNDHIGRKSTGNLCLTCKWKDCGTSCAKRDHITSHLRGIYLLPSPSP